MPIATQSTSSLRKLRLSIPGRTKALLATLDLVAAMATSVVGVGVEFKTVAATDVLGVCPRSSFVVAGWGYVSLGLRGFLAGLTKAGAILAADGIHVLVRIEVAVVAMAALAELVVAEARVVADRCIYDFPCWHPAEAITVRCSVRVGENEYVSPSVRQGENLLPFFRRTLE